MVFTLPRAGVDTYVMYSPETTYGTAVAPAVHFGLVQSVTPTNRRNLVQIRGFTGRTISGRRMVKAVGGKLETSISIEFHPQEWDWLKYVIGTRDGLGTAADKYEYKSTYSSTATSTTSDKLVDSTATFDANTLVGNRIVNTTDGTVAAITARDSGTTLSIDTDIMASGEAYTIRADRLTSLTISTSTELGSADRNIRYLGMKINSCTIRSAVGEPVTVTLELMGADLVQATALENPVALSATDPYTFVDSSIEIPNATPVPNIIDNFEVTITNNIEVLYGLGAYTGKNAISKAREYSLKMSFKTYDNTWSTDFLGSSTTSADPTENATVEFTLESNTTNKKMDLLFSNVTFDEWADPQTLGEVVPEEITAIAETLVASEQQAS